MGKWKIISCNVRANTMKQRAYENIANIIASINLKYYDFADSHSRSTFKMT